MEDDWRSGQGLREANAEGDTGGADSPALHFVGGVYHPQATRRTDGDIEGAVVDGKEGQTETSHPQPIPTEADLLAGHTDTATGTKRWSIFSLGLIVSDSGWW